MVHKKACLLATGNNNSSHANCMNQVEGILTRFKYSEVIVVINFLWYILKMGQDNIFVSGGGREVW